MDLFSIMLLVAEVIFIYCVIQYGVWIQKRKGSEPLSLPIKSATSIVALFFAVLNYFVGWKNCRRWCVGRLMWIWTSCLVGIVFSPMLFEYISATKPVQSIVVTAFLAICTLGVLYFTYHFYRAGRVVSQMWERPSHDTVAQVVGLGPAAIPHLLELVEMGDDDAVTAAADALSRIGAAGIARETLQALTTHSDALVRRTASQGLATSTVAVYTQQE